MKNTFIIVIPIYNETPKSYENIALTQLGNIIKKNKKIWIWDTIVIYNSDI